MTEQIPAWQQDDIDALEWENDNIETAEQKAAIAVEFLRGERNRLLAATDWWAVSDRTLTDAQVEYRQALRDITTTYSSLDDVVWPDQPA
jgi:hypothetical protein